jgi:hypothetical protein
MRALLDINVLIALLEAARLAHDRGIDLRLVPGAAPRHLATI